MRYLSQLSRLRLNLRECNMKIKYSKRFRITTNGKEYRIEIKRGSSMLPFLNRWYHYEGSTFGDSSRFGDSAYYSDLEEAKKDLERLEARSELEWNRRNLTWRCQTNEN